MQPMTLSAPRFKIQHFREWNTRQCPEPLPDYQTFCRLIFDRTQDEVVEEMHATLKQFGELIVPVAWGSTMGKVGSKAFFKELEAGPEGLITEKLFLKLAPNEGSNTNRRLASSVSAPETLGVQWVRVQCSNGEVPQSWQTEFRTWEQMTGQITLLPILIKQRFKLMYTEHCPTTEEEIELDIHNNEKDFTFYYQQIQDKLAGGKDIKVIPDTVHKYFVDPNNRQSCCYGAFRTNEPLKPTHDVTVVGYRPAESSQVGSSQDPAPARWIVRNSHGTSIGDGGYVYVEAGKNLMGIEESWTVIEADISDFIP
jgi:hypothetical protein